MTSSIQHTPITLPEIELSDNWDDLNFLPQTDPPRPPPHEPEPAVESDAITTGLTRALSLPRHLNRSSTKKKEEDNNIRTEVINIATSNPSHLFWVPASQHPEIAPAEFEKYVDTHGLTIRKKSIKRRQSVLSVYFTANDQQKLLEELAERDNHSDLDVLEESDENEDRKRKLVLRRSVSLHLPTAGGYARNVPDLLVFDRNSSPFDESRALVPKGDRPLLRRGARTNFKRNSSVTAPNRPILMNRKSESDCMNDGLEPEPMIRSSSADGGVTLSDQTEPLSPVVETEEIRDLCIASRPELNPLQSQPVQPQEEEQQDPIILERSVSASTANLHIGRKSSWSWAFWSDEKSSKKNNKIDPTDEQPHEEPQEQENNTRQPQLSKSSDAASISATTTSVSSNSNSSSSSKRFTLSSLFSRKSKHTSNLDSVITNGVLTKEPPKDFQLNRMHLARLPLHVERAIYKLSHVKLANPRRPLHEQVLISNQMFWYLSIIATNPPEHHHHQQQQHHQLQQQKKKKPRKLVKKQRPPSPQQQQQQQSSKLTKNAIASGGTFMANKSSSRESSTGFVVPDNYLNPKYQKKKSKVEYDPKLSDSSSGEEEEEDEDEDEEDQQKEDDLPLALYKTTSHRVK
ncbi:hypothetical protein EDC94DRAFT_653232 [Helicostylum pulchrum]|nr:hypothetical protein EDC94DRAFT_653232 [Helicostylum pulchrum]